VTAEYAIGVVTRSPAAGPARAVGEMVAGPAGQAILRRHGFAP
jgi:hypothetical protein